MPTITLPPEPPTAEAYDCAVCGEGWPAGHEAYQHRRAEAQLRQARRIIVCDEKHGATYWDANTDDAWARGALAIITQRLAAGWYFPPGTLEDLYGWKRLLESGPLLDQDQLAALPTAELRDRERQRLNRAKLLRQQHARDLAEYTNIAEIVARQDTSFTTPKKPQWRAPVAWKALEARNDHEYERVELAHVNHGLPPEPEPTPGRRVYV